SAIEVQRAFAVARKLSGIRQELTPHSLRHTFASWLGDLRAAAANDSGASRTRGRANDHPLRSLVPCAPIRRNADRWEHGNGGRWRRGFTRKCGAGNASELLGEAIRRATH